MTSHRTNGLMPDSAEAQLVALLDAAVEELQTRHDLLKSELAEVTAKLGRYKKMQGAGQAPASKSRKSPAPAPKSSAEMRERVLDALRAAGGPRTVKAIAETVGASRGIVDAAIRQLRDDELVRFAGKDTATRGTHPAMWATFPEPETVTPPASFRPAKAATIEAVLDAVRSHGQPATLTDIIARSGVSEVAVRNAVRALQEDGTLRDAGTAAARADGETHGKMPRTYALA